MDRLKPTYSVRMDEERGELHFVTSGLFDAPTMAAFLREVARQAGPVLASGRKLRAFGDLTDYVTQTKEIGEQMAQTLAQAESSGIEKTAIVINSAILKMQYKRVSEGRNVEIFETAEDALRWLRGDEG
ncbi:MAG: hypothetical protein SXU28_12985 [Pseudomonadota bacterium]|nr:hypothetical protein [Pseudomonadota bacterium]